MHTQVVQATQASIDAVSDLESSIFLQWVWLESNSSGAPPTRQPSLKVFGVARLAGLPVTGNLVGWQTHACMGIPDLPDKH